MKRIRKKKIKKIILLIVTIIIISTIIFLYLRLNNNKDKPVSKEVIISNILSTINDTNITEDFLFWINDKYGINTLIELDNILKEKTYNLNIWHEITNNSYIVLKDLYNNTYDNMKNIKIINKSTSSTISFVGDVSLADNWYIMPKYDERKKGIYGILSEDIVNIMSKSDIMIANNEFTISNRGKKLPNKTYTFRASPKRLSIYQEMGVDLVTLANNHVYDFGEDAFNDMIDSLNEYDIPYIGAGKDIEEAKRPYYFIINGYKIAFINATRAEKNILTPEATNTKGGVFRCYDPTNLIKLISETKKQSDYVVTLIHWGKEGYHDLEEVQKETSIQYIDAGADAIVGSHAHVLQGIEFYKSKPIIYNLGDFIFNQKNKDTGIFQIILNNDGNMEYYFIPAYQSNEYTKLLTDKEKERVINNMNSWSINAKIDITGKINQINN